MSERIFFARPESGVGWYANYESPTRQLSGWGREKGGAVADLLGAAVSAAKTCGHAKEADDAYKTIVAFARKNGFMSEGETEIQ